MDGPHLEECPPEDVRPFSRVKVGKPILPLKDGEYVDHADDTYNTLTKDDAKLTDELQKALDQGKDLVLCPGIFFLTKPLVIKTPNQVILGLGLATLVAPQDGSPCIRVNANTPGVRIAGIMLEASVQRKGLPLLNRNKDHVKSLIDFGEPDVADPGDTNNPGLLSDIFARVGGSNLNRKVSTDIMIRVHSGNVVGDNLWLWRADHVKLANGEAPNDPNFPLYHQVRIVDEEGKEVNECIVKTCLEVRGDDVKMYGLFCEHAVEHQMIWKEERGTLNFFQCELPYDVDTDFAKEGFVGNVVHPDVKKDTGRGIGVYCNFQVNDVVALSGMRYPNEKGVSLESPFTVFLNNKGGIKTVLKEGDTLFGVSANPMNKISRAWVGKKNQFLSSFVQKLL